MNTTTIQLPEKNVRIERGYVPKGKRDVNRLFEKIFEHEKNYYND